MNDFARLQDLLGYRFADLSILIEALTHPSCKKKSTDSCYERLEFLGDSILGAVVAEMLFKSFPQDDEGLLSRKMVMLVCRQTLVAVAKSLGLGEFILLSDSEESTGGRMKPSNLENVLEAIIASVFLDGGFSVAKSFIEMHWGHLLCNISDVDKNPKNILQEMTQCRGINLPEYELIQKTGADHDPLFKVKVTICNYCEAIAEGKTLKIAERNAAKLLVDKMRDLVESETCNK